MKVTIGKKIASIIVVMAVLIGINGIVGIVSIGRVGKNADIIMDEAKIIDLIQEVRVSFQQLLMPANDYLITGDKKEKPKNVKLKKTQAAEAMVKLPEEKPFRIAVGAMITPREGYAYYRQLVDYIGTKLRRPVEFVDRKTYTEINDLVRLGNVDVAFVCSAPYVKGHDEFGMELLVAPQAYGETIYYSYLIVPKDSNINSLEELRGKTFAFADPMSNSGKLAPTYMLGKMGETPDSFFQEYHYTYGHDKSIKAVAMGLVDGAAVDSLIWEYGNRTNPEFTSKTRIIEKSPPYGIPPVVVRPDLGPELKAKTRQILLDVHKDEKGKEILKGMMVDKFVLIKDSAYDSIRRMKLWVEGQKK